MKGLFITFEGADGGGKTTQVQKAAQRLTELGYEVVVSREPGGTLLAEKVRALVLDADLPLNNRSEVLLYLAARSEHAEKVLLPAVQAGKIVLCDRFSDSTLVYQGLAKGLEYEQLEKLKKLNAFACGGLTPDLTLLLDGDTDVLLKRRTLRGVQDRYENKSTDFQRQLRRGFLQLAEQEPQRIRIINAAAAQEEVAAAVWREIERLLPGIG